jgi:hypothetical protein
MVQKTRVQSDANAMRDSAAIKVLVTWGIIRSKIEDNRRKDFPIDSVLEIN